VSEGVGKRTCGRWGLGGSKSTWDMDSELQVLGVNRSATRLHAAKVLGRIRNTYQGWRRAARGGGRSTKRVGELDVRLPLLVMGA